MARCWLTLLLLGTSAAADDSRLASVQVGGCSGTLIAVIGKRGYGISAAHCAKAGQPVSVTNSKGKRVEGEWIVVDSASDLSLFTCPASVVEDVAPLGTAKSDGELHGFGWPGGKGPSRIKLSEDGEEKPSNLLVIRSRFKVKSGRFRNGSSGGGIFRGDRLVGVQTHGDDDKLVLAATLTQLLSFAEAQGRTFSVNLTNPSEQKSGPLTGPLSSDRDRTGAIADIREFLLALSKEPGPPGSPGPPGTTGTPGTTGPAGKDGRDGTDADPTELEQLKQRIRVLEQRVVALEEWRRNFKATIRVRVIPKE